MLFFSIAVLLKLYLCEPGYFKTTLGHYFFICKNEKLTELLLVCNCIVSPYTFFPHVPAKDFPPVLNFGNTDQLQP